MSFGGSPATTTNVSRTELPAWVDQAGQSNYNAAVAMGNKPLEQYASPTVAGVSPTTKQAFSFFKDNMGSGSADTGAASDIYKNLANPEAVNSGINSMLNPYLGQVEGNALRSNEEARVKALATNADSAIASKAFGGSRGAIVDALTNSEAIKNAGDLSAGIRSAGYNTATQNYLSTQQAGANGLMASGAQKQAQMLKDFAGLTQIGGAEQAQDQAEINANVKKFGEARDKPLNDLNLRLSALGMSPYSSQTSSSGTSTAQQQGPDWASTGLGILSLFMGLSDDDTKTDKELVGRDEKSGLDIWAYRYKKDPKNYPKVVGVMASDVEKKMPEAVTTLGGKRVINYGMLAGLEA